MKQKLFFWSTMTEAHKCCRKMQSGFINPSNTITITLLRSQIKQRPRQSRQNEICRMMHANDMYAWKQIQKRNEWKLSTAEQSLAPAATSTHKGMRNTLD